jgi:hypothetical protein
MTPQVVYLVTIFHYKGEVKDGFSRVGIFKDRKIALRESMGRVLSDNDLVVLDKYHVDVPVWKEQARAWTYKVCEVRMLAE